MNLPLKFAAAFSALMAAISAALAQSPIKIGFVAELSGPQAVLGQDQYDAFMLYVDRNGGKLGGVPVQVLKEDSQLKPDIANQLVQKLLEKEKVSIITGFTFSNIAMAVHKLIADQEVFFVGSNAGPSPMAGAQCSPYQFVVSWQTDQLAEAVGQYATDKGYQRMYLMAPNYQAGKDFLTGFKRRYKGQILDEIYTPLNQIDFSAELTQLSASKPDAVFVFYPGALGIGFVRQFQQMGFMNKIPLLTGGAVDGSTLPALKEAAIGSITSAPWAPDAENAANKRFVAEFEERYKRIPSMFAAQSYDAAQLLDVAIANVKGNVADKPAFAKALKGAQFESVRGGFKFGNNNFPIQDFRVQQVAKDDRGRVNLKTVAIPLRMEPDSYHTQCPMK